MKKEEDKLDNPVWHSLQECHQDFALCYDPIHFYSPDYCPFGASIPSMGDSREGIEAYGRLSPSFYVVGDRPHLPDTLMMQKALHCQQMVLPKAIEPAGLEEIIPLKNHHNADLLDLVNLVQPGYFNEKTPDLGNYYGIFKQGMLVAVTGERMNMHAYTEISAVVTHPEHTGKGYAKQLILHASQGIFDKGKRPFLHVADTNSGAIKLYEKLGFLHRRSICFWNIVQRSGFTKPTP